MHPISEARTTGHLPAARTCKRIRTSRTISEDRKFYGTQVLILIVYNWEKFNCHAKEVLRSLNDHISTSYQVFRRSRLFVATDHESGFERNLSTVYPERNPRVPSVLRLRLKTANSWYGMVHQAKEISR